MEIYQQYLHDKKFTLMTHLASSNDASNPSNDRQFKIFDDISSKLNNSKQVPIILQSHSLKSLVHKSILRLSIIFESQTDKKVALVSWFLIFPSLVLFLQVN